MPQPPHVERGTSSIRRNRTRISVHDAVLRLALAIALTGMAQAAPADARTPRANDARGADSTPTLHQSSHPHQAFMRAASTLADRQRAAIRRLEVAARNLRRSVDAVTRVPNDADLLKVTQAQIDRPRALPRQRRLGCHQLGRVACPRGRQRAVHHRSVRGLAWTRDEMIAAWLEAWSEHQDRDPEGAHRIGSATGCPRSLRTSSDPNEPEAALSASRLRRWPLPA